MKIVLLSARSTPFTLAHDGLFRSMRFAAYLAGGGRCIGRAALATGLWLGVVLLPLLLPLPRLSVIVAMIIAPTVAMMPAGLGVMSGSKTLSVRANLAFWLRRRGGPEGRSKLRPY